MMTTEQRDFVFALYEVSKDLGLWAYDQIKAGLTPDDIRAKLRNAATAAGREG